ncbi:tRNA-dihydrouridine synthase family protein [Candidatus Woesearchaeota archaeon]|nr:tRNA-dihydrouridine synthase family protein [Candidatus Woesearchaeota archaeon]
MNLKQLKNSLFLAPMRGVNCAAFRVMSKEYGCDVTSTPMIITDDLISDSSKVISRLNLNKTEKPVSIQLIGNKNGAESVSLIEDHADIIDINLGCPDKKFLGLKYGSYLLSNLPMMEKFVSSIVGASNKPVTAKIRLGFNDNNSLIVSKKLEDLGVNAITVHGRTTKQGYTGVSDINAIKKVKENVNIPIIANGDVFKPGNAKSLLEKTGCNGVMIGRGVMGNPFLFSEVKYLLENGKNTTKSVDKKTDAIKFTKYYEKYDYNVSFTEYRQHIMWFSKNLLNAAIIKDRILRVKTFEKVNEIINSDIFR